MYEIQESCSHTRAHSLFLESLNRKFVGVRCASFRDIKEKICVSDGATGLMGGNISKNTPKPLGIFYLETTGEPPYVISNHLKFKNTSILYGPKRTQITHL